MAVAGIFSAMSASAAAAASPPHMYLLALWNGIAARVLVVVVVLAFECVWLGLAKPNVGESVRAKPGGNGDATAMATAMIVKWHAVFGQPLSRQ